MASRNTAKREMDVIDAVTEILAAAGRPLKARELCGSLERYGVRLGKGELNQILYGLGKQRGLVVEGWAWSLAPSAPRRTTVRSASRVLPIRPTQTGTPRRNGSFDGIDREIVEGWPRSCLTVPPAAADQRAITWTAEQQVIIELPASRRALVIAGPGTGKTAVACARISRLLASGVSPSSIMMFSFTRAAVSEIRDRIAAKAAAGEQDAAAVRITTLDSAAWYLNRGLGDQEDENLFKGFGENIQDATRLIRNGRSALREYLQRFDHVLVDEAQDLVAERADLVLVLLGALRKGAGFTVFADPAQAIYGFTRDDEDIDRADEKPTFIERLRGEFANMEEYQLTKLHRARDESMSRLFTRARAAVTSQATGGELILKVAEAVQRNSVPIDRAVDELEFTSEQLILFRRRSDVLQASSYVSSKRRGTDRCHRLRLSGFPQAIHPWVAVLLWDFQDTKLTRAEFDARWRARLEDREPDGSADVAWQLLQRTAGVQRGVDVRRLISVLARPRPPFEFCMQDGGGDGPVLGTIHASKGRQARDVVLLLPAEDVDSLAKVDPAEQARVIYVGATRARESLRCGQALRTRFRRSESGRVFRRIHSDRLQFEVGRAEDVDWESPVSIDVIPDQEDARAVQALLARGVAHAPCHAELDGKSGWKRYILKLDTGDREHVVGALSPRFVRDLRAISKAIGGPSLAPRFINHLVVYGVCSVAVDPDNQNALGGLHEEYRRTGLFLAPLVKGFVTAKLVQKKRNLQ